jgi:hypothetical protein
MRADVISMAADWLADTTSGVNALLSKVPKDTGVSTPANVSIADETRHGWVARGETPRAESLDGPVIAVFLKEPIVYEWNEDGAAQRYHTARVALGMAYYASNVTSETGNIAESITLRALRGSLVLFQEQLSKASREKNKVRIDRLVGIEEVPSLNNKEDSIIAGGIIARFETIDVIPDLG